MQKQLILIESIPSILWGSASDRLFVAVHGDQSNKADDVIRIFAEVAVKKGYQVLSFDLPEHGDRKEEARLCNAQNCVEDLMRILTYARARSNSISLFGCSVGAFFSMLAYKDAQIRQALFLSPVVDMKRIINNMMTWFNVSEERLEKEQAVATPFQTLYWDYYKYILNHPVEWDKPTALLYGARDTLCEPECVYAFAERANAAMTVLENGEHFFRTEKQLDLLRKWLFVSMAT